jgi:dolichyl-phosphate-mannose-protein mannosyltransferase
VYTIPWQVNTDEITLMSFARDLIAVPNADVFGISGYFGCPAAAFLFFGKVAHMMGGINLNNVRLLHGLLGIASIIATYALFRGLSASVRISATAALIVAANHSLIAYSRMGMWSDSALLLEILSLYCIGRALRTSSFRAAFIAGVTSGLAFYVYFPGRIAIALCGVILLVMLFVHAPPRPVKRTIQYGVMLLAGWLMVTAPVLIATARNAATDTQYQREQLLIYPEGQAAAERWTHTLSPAAAWMENVKLGLETFNARVVDHGWLYPNYNHGFVDPLTGVLIWIGVIFCAVGLVRFWKHGRKMWHDASLDEVAAPVLSLVCFAILYLTLAFLVTKAPNYQRLLMILPFVGYLASAGLWALADLMLKVLRIVTSLSRSRAVTDVTSAMVVIVILVLNIQIFRDFTVPGRRNGHEVGSTGRMIASRRNERGHTWILAADKDHPYYFWGEPWWWRGWVGFFAGENQPVEVIPPAKLASSVIPRSATVFVSKNVWKNMEAQFRSDHSVTSVTNVMPDGRLLAIEIKSQR